MFITSIIIGGSLVFFFIHRMVIFCTKVILFQIVKFVDIK